MKTRTIKISALVLTVVSVVAITLGVVIAENTQNTPSEGHEAVETTEKSTISEETDVVPPEESTEHGQEETTNAVSNGTYSSSNDDYTPSTTVVGVKKGKVDIISTTIVCDGEKCTEEATTQSSYREEEATVVTPPSMPSTTHKTVSTQNDATDDRGTFSVMSPVAEDDCKDDVIIVEGTTVNNEQLPQDIEDMF